MKTLRQVFTALLVIHFLLLIAGVAWLRSSGRLNGDRLRRVGEMFRPTIAQESAAREEKERADKEDHEKAVEAARLESVGAGPVTISDRLRTDEEKDTVALQRIERLKRETADLRAQLEVYKGLLSKQKEELEAERAAFNELKAKEEQLRNDTDFQQAVAMYEKLRPKQAKEMFQVLIKDGKKPQVIDYLAAMQLKKASDVLKEFKSAEEVAQATELVQRLRERGIDPSAMKPRAAGDST